MVVYLVVGRNIFFPPFVPERMYRGDCFSLSSITIDSRIGYQRAVQPVDRWRRLILRQRDDWADFKASNMAPRRQVLHAPGNQLISVALELIHPVQKSKKAQKLVRNMMDRDPRLVHCMLSVSLNRYAAVVLMFLIGWVESHLLIWGVHGAPHSLDPMTSALFPERHTRALHGRSAFVPVSSHFRVREAKVG